MDALDIRNIAEEAIREHERKYHTGEPGELTPTGTHEKLMFGVSAENSETPPAPAPAKPMFRPRQWVIEKGPVLYKTTPWQIGRASAIRSVNGNHSYLKDNGVWWDESDLRLAKPSDFREKIGEVEMWAETNKNGSVSIFMDGRLTGRVHKPEIVPVKYFDAEIEMLRRANIPIIPLEVLNGDNEKAEDELF